MTLTRRELGRLVLAPVAASALAAINSRLSGVQIGAQSYSFRDRPLDAMIAAMVEIGLGECELWQGHVEPRSSSPERRAELRKWRTTVPLDYFTGIRRKCSDAGIFISAYNYSF